jgi:hypothetical protein
MRQMPLSGGFKLLCGRIFMQPREIDIGSRLADLVLQSMVGQGKMKSTIRRVVVSKASCWLGLGGHGSCRSTGNTEEPIGSIILSGELCGFVEFLCVDFCDLVGNISEASVTVH